MEKRLVAILLTMVVAMASFVPVTVRAEDEELTNIQPAGDTAVEADIINGESGDVSYIISIPEKIDFGTLQMPADSKTAHPKNVDFTVSAVEINNLDTTKSRVAVLMKDAATGNKTFQIVGASGTNNSKILTYNVLSSAGVDITNGTSYQNGYLFAAFSSAGQSINGSLSLEQNQLLADTTLENWAGDYFGTINFYTAIASISDY